MKELQEAGLTESESKVYLALLDNGASLAGRISRKTGLHRRSIYDVLEMLIKKGLVGYIVQNNRKIFSAVNPSRLLEMIHEKEDLLSGVISGLQERFGAVHEKEETLFFKGKEGLKSVFEQQLEAKEILILGASPLAYSVLQFYFKWYDIARKKKKIHARIIASEKLGKIPLADVRYLPEKYASPMAVNIYGDRVAIILWAASPIVIVIKSKEIAQGYRNYFELMWRIARKK